MEMNKNLLDSGEFHSLKPNNTQNIQGFIFRKQSYSNRHITGWGQGQCGHAVKIRLGIGIAWDCTRLFIQPICTMNHVPLCCDCDHDLRSYRRLADYPFEKNHRQT